MKHTGVLLLLVFALRLVAQPSLIPYPQKLQSSPIAPLALSSVHIERSASVQQEADFLKAQLLQRGIPVSKDGAFPLRLNRIQPDTLLPEGWYQLKSNAQGCFITACSNQGLFYGVQSLLALLQEQSGQWHLPAVEITDYPQFAWRGMHLDVSRHFFPVSFIKQYIDLLAQHKMNRFHWHLTDDQGWRIEIKAFPRLTAVGAWRKGSMIGHYSEQRFDSLRYGGFYTQDDIREVVAYAAQRHITVVPEIEMPGHAQAALAAYPQYSCTGGPFEVAQGWGVFDDVFCPTDSTFAFLEQVLKEVMDLFPGEFIHIGGDECPKTRWEACPKCKARMQQEGLADGHALQSYFIRRIEKFLNARGRQIIGWDEILEGGLAPNAAVMSWRGTEGGIAAAKLQHKVVMSPGTHCYFDHYQADPRQENLAIGGYTTLEKVLAYHPVPDALRGTPEAQWIMGAQGNVWTEYMYTEADVLRMALPRMSALAEVLWTGPGQTAYPEFLKRLNPICSKWEAQDLHPSRSAWRPELFPETRQGMPGIGVRHAEPCTYVVDTGQQPKAVLDGFIPLQGLKAGQHQLIVAPQRGVQATYTVSRIQCNAHKALFAKLSLNHVPSKYYPGDGERTLHDGIRAVLPRVNREWLAWSGEDVELTYDFGQSDTLHRIELGVFHDPGNWIYHPKSYRFEVSMDGQTWQTWVPERSDLKDARMWVFENPGGFRARYLRIRLQNAGTIPNGAPGAGKNAWLFLDEIAVY